jgi:chromosome segregation ATPase
VSGLGNGLSAAGLALSTTGNPLIAAIAGVVTAAVSIVTSLPTELEEAQEELAKAEEKAEKSNIERAEKKNEYETLKRETANLRELEKARFDSAEAQQEWINANNALFEQFPYLAATFDEVGNATIDLESAEQALALARKASLSATIKAAEDEKARIEADLNTVKTQQKTDYEEFYSGSNYKLENGKTYSGNPLLNYSVL